MALAGGADENLTALGDPDYLDALATLRRIDDVNIIAIPDNTGPVVQQALITHCEQMQDRFAVLDAKSNLSLFEAGAIQVERLRRRKLNSAADLLPRAH